MASFGHIAQPPQCRGVSYHLVPELQAITFLGILWAGDEKADAHICNLKFVSPLGKDMNNSTKESLLLKEIRT